MSDSGPPVDPTRRDRALSALQGLTGIVPAIGPILANLISQIIPEQRWERIGEYLRKLERRVAEVEARTLASALREPRKVDLFEDGAVQAVRALSSERLEYIATLVARGLTSDEREAIEATRLLKLLDQIDDDQIVILQSKLHRHIGSDEFYERHQEVLEPVRAHMQSPREDLDRAAMYRLTRRQLVDVGLLHQTFRKPRKGDLPEFDEKTGMIKSQGTKLSPLGRLLLRRIGLAEEDEF
ncbi:MAG: hypothetical protein OXG83_11285 [Acidobacteria bacterium]|nr:hypothetical protein [Acidobacteriota bacterium]